MTLELPEGWRDEMPDDIKTNGVLDDITTIDQMAKMIVSARAAQSNSIHIPGADAGEDKRKEFITSLQEKVPDLVYVGEGADMENIYDRMGRPSEATGYEMPDIPDPLKDNMASLAQKAHELGITKGQMKGISDLIVGDFKDNTSKVAGALEKAVSEIKSEFGEAYESKLKNASDFAKQVGFDDTLVEAVSKGHVGLENMKALEKLQEGFKSPGPRIGDDQGSNEFTHLTPEQAEIQISEMLNNKDHPYWNGADPAHNAAVTKMVELTRAAEAGKPQSETEKFRDALLGRG